MQVPYDPWNVKAHHTANEYMEALRARRRLFRGGKYRQMLTENYHAPNHTLTAGELARAVGYKSYSAANRNYGRLGAALAEQLGHTPGRLEGVGVPTTVDVAILVTFSGGSGKPVQWRLLPALAQALEELVWV